MQNTLFSELKVRLKLRKEFQLVRNRLSLKYVHSYLQQLLQVVDVGSLELVHTFTPQHEECDEELPPTEPPITKMFTSGDGQWLAAVNCFGDLYIFNLETQRYSSMLCIL